MPAGFDQVQICNMALSNIGVKARLQSITENNPPARACLTWYDAARLGTLEVHDWTFARKSLVLAAHSTAAPTLRWAYRYQYPVDCVAPRYLENPAGPDSDAVPMDVEEGDDDTLSIVTDLAEATLIYTKNTEDVTRFSMHFTLMLALRLGYLINPQLTGKVSIGDRVFRRFNDMEVLAPTVDGRARIPRKERDASWIRARN